MKKYFRIIRDGKTLTSGNTVGMTEDYFNKLAAGYGGKLEFSDESFVIPLRPENQPLIFGRTWEEIQAMQQKRF